MHTCFKQSLAALLLIGGTFAIADPTTQSAPTSVQVNPLPDGWVIKKPTVKTAVQFAEYPDLIAFFEIANESADDFTQDVDLAKWAAMAKESAAKKSTLLHRDETPLKANKVGERDTMEYEVTGDLKSVKLHFRIVLVKVGDTYCKLTCWTTPSHWAAAQAKFDELISLLK